MFVPTARNKAFTITSVYRAAILSLNKHRILKLRERSSLKLLLCELISQTSRLA